MARGAEAKQNVMDKIMEIFPDAFIYGKELRIPMQENGERVEIKVALTCAKTNVGGNDGSVESETQTEAASNVIAAPTEEEKANIADLMNRLGL